MYPYMLIRMSRLLLFVRIGRENPPFVLTLLLQATFGKESWVACLQQDLAWLAVSEKFRSCAAFSLDQWIGFFNSHPESAKSITVGVRRRACNITLFSVLAIFERYTLRRHKTSCFYALKKTQKSNVVFEK